MFSSKKVVLKKVEAPKKYVLRFTAPTGQQLLASGFEGKFALFPVSGNSMKGQFLVWDTPLEVSKFVKKLKGTAPPEEFKKLWAMKPEIISVQINEEDLENTQ